MATPEVKIAERQTVSAGKENYSFIKSAGGSVISYTLEQLKSKLGLSIKGKVVDGVECAKAFAYSDGEKIRFELVHLKSNTSLPVWASGKDSTEGLKGIINEMNPYKKSKNENPYYWVPTSLIAFYRVVRELEDGTQELGLVVGKIGEADDAVTL